MGSSLICIGRNTVHELFTWFRAIIIISSGSVPQTLAGLIFGLLFHLSATVCVCESTDHSACQIIDLISTK
ncbi:hypothetical protein RIF29_08282 [Crotalaria pallida]|uniref:Uncharacterized protein n=1 Tax=Crotalaria pallida TaxID=3830 RepID=A0AAN9J6N1_CROPI